MAVDEIYFLFGIIGANNLPAHAAGSPGQGLGLRQTLLPVLEVLVDVSLELSLGQVPTNETVCKALFATREELPVNTK